MGDRVVDCARLESVCAERHRGFESLPIRQVRKYNFIERVVWPGPFTLRRFERRSTGGARHARGLRAKL
jgi:hypothetical protein